MSRRDLGELDAAREEKLQRFFVSSEEYHRLDNNRSKIIYGAKGTGKTALKRALCEFASESYLATYAIDLDSLKFNAIQQALKEVSVLNYDDPPRLAQTAWTKLLYVVSAGLAAHCIADANCDLSTKILQFLKKNGFDFDDMLGGPREVPVDAHNFLIRAIKWYYHLLIDLNQGNAEIHASAEVQFEPLQTPTIDPGLVELLREAARVLNGYKKHILICLDGLDSITGTSSREARNAVFSGLIDAIFKATHDPLVCGAFCYKAFLPAELAPTTPTNLWDEDKHYRDIVQLHWTPEELKEFIVKRLAQWSKRTGDAVWLEAMPQSVRNSAHNYEEDCFEYILRHTLHRPRQLLMQIQEILDGWKGTGRVDPTFIPPRVRATNETLAFQYVSQIGHTVEGVDSFLKSFRGSPTTMQMDIFLERLSRYLVPDGDDKAVSEMFNELYGLGVFGLFDKEVAAPAAKLRQYKFSFVGTPSRQRVYPSESSEIALAPVLKEYCQCSSGDQGIVIPTDGRN